MDTSNRVVVVGSLECKQNADKTRFAVRIRELGLTTYGDSLDEAMLKLKKMFSDFVGLHRKHGTLVQRLNKSNLRWCAESDYNGSVTVEFVRPDGVVEVIFKKDSPIRNWQEMKELAVVC